jgi:hemoglobin
MRRAMAGLVLGVVAVVGVAGCATTNGAATRSEPTLYKRLGGREGIALIVDDLVAAMQADARVNAHLKTLTPVQLFKLKTNLADRICDAAGGPCSYLGEGARAAAAVSDAQWSAVLEDLGKALDKHHVAPKERRELTALLTPMKAELVGE